VRGREPAVKDTLDFIVIGAQKAGTTSLFEHLRQHPQLYLPPGKELPYFSHEPIRRRGWEDYIGKAFFDADPQRHWGTVTPQYMVGGLWEEPNPTAEGEHHDERTVPLRIRERAPRARLVAILREPAQRARAQHRMAVMNHLDARPFGRAVDELLAPGALEAARREPRETTGYVTWGEYGRILSGYLEVFPREQLLVVFTDELESDPAALLRRIHAFLGVRADFLPADLGVRYRVGGTERRLGLLAADSPMHPWTLQRRLTRSGAARRVWHALSPRGRHRIDHALARATYRLDLWNRREGRRGPGDDQDALARLRAHYVADGALLERIVGVRPPWTERS
jgi:Sulfotransferase family